MCHGKVNAMDFEFCKEFRNTLNQLAKTKDCQAIILSGYSKVFSAGIDLKRWLAESPDYVTPFMNELEQLFQDVFAFPKPLVSLIEGPAVAGGCMLAAACDFRVISPIASIGIPEMRIGVALPMAAIEIMRFVCHNQAFQAVVNLGKMFQGNEAVAVGLASHCPGHGSPDAKTLVRRRGRTGKSTGRDPISSLLNDQAPIKTPRPQEHV